MSWLFSRALVAAYSEESCSAGRQYVASKLTRMLRRSWPHGRTKARLIPSQFGTIYKRSTGGPGGALLTWFLGASRARTLAQQAEAKVFPESDPDSGEKWRASLARFDPVTSLWKTAQCSLLADSEPSSVTWPRSGMTVDGRCLELPMSGRFISAIGSGLWPTPTNCGNYNRKGASANSGDGLATAVKQWPTPTATLGTKGGRVTPRKSSEGVTLIEAVSNRQTWPTPHGFSPDGRTNGPSGNELGRAVNQSLYATPTARDHKSGKASQETHDRNSRPLSEQIGGSLNPDWVEWLMLWPIGWTDLNASVTGKSQSVQQQHGES